MSIPEIKTSPDTLIGPQVLINGRYTVTVGAHTIIQTRARIVSNYGPVTIGECCIISERATIGFQTRPIADAGSGSNDDNTTTRTDEREGETERRGVMICLDSGVMVETAAVVEAQFVGEGTVIEVGAKVGQGCVIGKHCKIAPLSNVPAFTTLPDYTVIYGNYGRRMDKLGLESLRAEARERHIDTLRTLAAATAKSGRL